MDLRQVYSRSLVPRWRSYCLARSRLRQCVPDMAWLLVRIPSG
ncbi:unnamed protein product [Acanthoscelides obtectus]|uniref:Uncharacterized protein n=1 Tax=Acanthoscelides obtectus TaxID=200917 RepID=A0A9P0MA07_ACAOB|nr:unnamed protein product [Acanthoscelides obtectus]CAK1635127.1 hypothetical protein AOBTE_LOCUS9076 [Acanthoscelides obtectus]